MISLSILLQNETNSKIGIFKDGVKGTKEAF